MLGYLRLMRPLNCLMTAIAVLIGGLIVLKGDVFYFAPVYMAMLAAFLIAGGGNAINDYVDFESDRINRPKRPIPGGQVSRSAALVFSAVLFIIGIVLAGFINWIAFLIALVNSLLLIGYSTSMQNKLLLGNIAVSYLVGSSFLFGGAAVGNLMLPFLLLLLSGLANMSREIVKDLEDIEGDRKSFLKRITSKIKEKIAERFRITKRGAEIRVGRKKLKAMAGISLFLAVLISPLPYILGILGMSYLAVLALTDLVFLVALAFIYKSHTKKQFHRTSRLIKLGMFLGLIAFIAGALV